MDPETQTDQPPIFNYVLSFLLVGLAWGFTTPFIRRAAKDFNAAQEARRQGQGQAGGVGVRTENRAEEDEAEDSEEHELLLADENENENENGNENGKVEKPKEKTTSWIKNKIVSVFWTIVNLLRTPAYLIPLLLNLSGSIWFFLLVGKHELSLTVPIANSSAFLFTVLGEWYVERKVIAKETWLGMGLVLAGIALCVHSKNQNGV